MVQAVIIKDYDANWSREFEAEKEKLKRILKDSVVSVEHIGSTSVVGLGAKPILDIAVGVINLKIVDQFIEPLKQIDYEFVYHKEFPERRFFRKGQRRAGTHHLHFYKFGSEHWKNQILFRNYLKNNPDTLAEYHQLKVGLAEKYRLDRFSYTAAKAPFIQSVLTKAKKEIE